MIDLTESVVKSLDGSSNELHSFLPYLLQDLWEIGSSPKVIVELLQRNTLPKHSKVLDLGCGKGSVSIAIAKELGFSVEGIDGMPAFISEAEKYSAKFGVDHLCSFKVGDIRNEVEKLADFDAVILGSIGPVFGSLDQTLQSVSKCINKHGMIILDDAYIPEGSDFRSDNYITEYEFFRIIENSKTDIIDKYKFEDEFMEESDEFIYNHIRTRAEELIKKFPEHSQLFLDYLNKQQAENEILENKVECITLVLKQRK